VDIRYKGVSNFLGGYSGAKLENTVIVIPIISITGLLLSSSPAEQETCKGSNWCALGSYNCDDCNLKSYCTSCLEGCVYSDSLLGENCALVNFCPKTQDLSFDTTTHGTIWPNGQAIRYTLVIETISESIDIKVVSMGYEGALSLQIFSSKINRVEISQDPRIILNSYDSDLYFGPYSITVRKEGNDDFTAPIEFTITATHINWNDTLQQLPEPEYERTFDAFQFMTVFAVSMLFWLSISIAAKRIRDRLFLNRVVISQLEYMSRIRPVAFYEVKIGGEGWVVGNGRPRRSTFLRRTSMRDSALLYINSGINGLLTNLGVSSKPGSTYELQTISGVGKSDSSHDMSGAKPATRGLMGRLIEKVTPRSLSSQNMNEMEAGVASVKPSPDKDQHTTHTSNIVKTAQMQDTSSTLYVSRYPNLSRYPWKRFPRIIETNKCQLLLRFTMQWCFRMLRRICQRV
jgi:hypothetical protein